MADLPTLSKRQLEFLEALHKGAKAFLIVTRAGAQAHCVGLGSIIMTTVYSLEKRGLIDRVETRNPGNWDLVITPAGVRAFLVPGMSNPQRALLTRMVKEKAEVTMETGFHCTAWIGKAEYVDPSTILALERLGMVNRKPRTNSQSRFDFACSDEGAKAIAILESEA